MKNVNRAGRWAAQRLGVSPRQATLMIIGVACIGGALVGSLFGIPTLRDLSLALLATVVLLFPISILRALTIKSTSIRKDIQTHAQANAASARRVEGVLGSAQGPAPVGLAVGNSLGRSGAYFGVGSQYEYAQRALLNLGPYETYALRAKSFKMRDVLARSASGLQFDYADLMRIINTSSLTGLKKNIAIYRLWNKDALTALARVVGNQQLRSDDTMVCVSVFAFVEQVFGPKALGRTDRKLYIESLSIAGTSRETEKKMREFGFANKHPLQADLIRANLLKKASGVHDDQWLTLVNRVLATDNLLPVSLEPGNMAAIDRLHCDQPARQNAKNLPMVTVIVPTHNGADLIETALRSLTKQTWPAIEIIVVDDKSSDEQLVKLRSVCSRYENVVLVEQSENLGAYMSRNAGLSRSSGDFITVHDDDDWSHPEKIARQVSHLVDNSSIPANMSLHSRATDDLTFARININLDFIQPNYSSIMVRREVIEEIGGWDTVNRGADAEFRDRINSHFPVPVAVVGAAPMSFTRTRIGSLTHGELDRGYIEPARLMYQQAYMQAHGEGKTRVNATRSFVAPLDMHPGMRGQNKGRFDVVYATDFRFPGGTTSLALAEITAALDMGLRVGVLQLDSPLNKPGTGYSERLLNLFLEKEVSLLRLADDYDASLLIIRHPSVVQFLDTRKSPARFDECVLIANTAPVLATGRGAVYDLRECREHVKACFGTDAVIVPESGVTRGLLTRVEPGLELAPFDWPGFVSIPEVNNRTPRQSMPVVGRHARDHRLKWPDSAQDLSNAYDQPAVFSTHILGGMDSVAKVLPKEAASRINVSPFGGLDVTDYLASLDFWVYFHSETTIESFGMAAAEAMASGLVVILPEYMASTFGDAAVYGKPSDVADIVRSYWNDASKYREQSERARRYVKETYSASSYTARLRRLLGMELSVKTTGVLV